MFLDRRCGSWQDGTDASGGPVTFTVYYPPGPDPEVVGIGVVGDFQHLTGGADWDPATALPLTRTSTGPAPGEAVWSVTTPVALPAGYHEYAYEVRFSDGSRRVGDPCARYGGRRSQTSGIVVGGSRVQVQPLAQRLPWRDLVVYELMIDDFTAGYREGAAPVDAVRRKLQDIAALGFNAIEFMPWTAWCDPRFDWGYEPCQYFAVETRYTRDASAPAEHLSRLKRLVGACHDLGLHVIMDGVFNHTSLEFPYARLYHDQRSCPLVGKFGDEFGGLQDLDFDDPSTGAFVEEVCGYWMKEFGIDGIRLDAAKWYDDPDYPDHGLPEVIGGIRARADDLGLDNFSVVLEYIDPSAAPKTEQLQADGYWDEALMEATNEGLDRRRVDGRLLAALTPRAALHGDRVPCTYLSNHDHSQVLWRLGKSLPNGGIDEWWRLQPYLIALYTGTGVPLVPNGQELGEEHAIPQVDHATRRRIMSRPVRWTLAGDDVGQTLRDLHRRLGRLRQDRPALRSARMEPGSWGVDQTGLDADGLGLDADRQVVVFRRLTDPDDPARLVTVLLNFSDQERQVRVRLPVEGTWTDLLSGFRGGADRQVDAVDGFATVTVGSHWGAVLGR